MSDLMHLEDEYVEDKLDFEDKQHQEKQQDLEGKKLHNGIHAQNRESLIGLILN